MGCRNQGGDVFHLHSVKGKYLGNISALECFVLALKRLCWNLFSSLHGQEMPAPSSFHQQNYTSILTIVIYDFVYSKCSTQGIGVYLKFTETHPEIVVFFVACTLNDVVTKVKCRKFVQQYNSDPNPCMCFTINGWGQFPKDSLNCDVNS